VSTNNIDLFSYLPGLEVSPNEVLEAELIAQQILTAKFQTMDLREGTALRDLVLRPTATLLAMINKALTFYFQQNTLSGVTDSTPQAFVDKLLENWFLSRKLGRTAVINARIYFAKSKNIALYPDISFSTDGKLKFHPISAMSFAASQLTFDPSANQYFLDVDLVAAAAGKDYNITSGSLLYFSTFDPYMLHAEINYLKEIAEDIETNTKFITRAKSAISTRNLINVPSITTNLLDTFAMLDGVYPVGMGSKEMTRDQIKVLVPGVADPIWIHNGGCVDAYCRVPLASSILQLTTDATGKVDITGSIYKIERSSITGGALDDTLPLQNYQTVTSLTTTGSVATADVAAHGYSNGDQITIAGALPLAYNGVKTITVTGLGTFTFPIASGTATPATGTITAGKDVPFTTSNKYWITATPTTIARTGSTATVTMDNHGLMQFDRVTISGANQAEYNNTFVLTDVPTKDTFTVTVTGTPATPATGTLVVKYVDRNNDVGFSDRQYVVADFGVGHANKTVSFVLHMHQNINGLQDYLSDAEKRVLCGDIMARGFNLTMLDIAITGYNGPAPNATTCNDVVVAYLSLLEPGQPFVMSDLLAKLYAANITTIQTPLSVTYTKYWNDLLANTTGTITDVMAPNDTTNIFVINSLTTTNQVIV